MTERISLAVIQFAPEHDFASNIRQVEYWLAQAVDSGANIVCLPELLCGPYFCKVQDEALLELAAPEDNHPLLRAISQLAEKYAVILPASFFEKDGPEYYNSVTLFDADGQRLGKYRKTHIPDGPGYQEKFYFRPGPELPRAYRTKYGIVGLGICWDQWFPEIARHLALRGADCLIYPTAIGSEPQNPALDTQPRWHRVMQGHAVANVLPIAAANRIGVEEGQTFYGSSCIIGPDGSVDCVLSREEPGVAVHGYSASELERERAAWGFFRDRRTDLYEG